MLVKLAVDLSPAQAKRLRVEPAPPNDFEAAAERVMAPRLIQNLTFARSSSMNHTQLDPLADKSATPSVVWRSVADERGPPPSHSDLPLSIRSLIFRSSHSLPKNVNPAKTEAA